MKYKDNGIVYPVSKYHESDGIRVYTPIKSWSEERTEEYKLRRWEKINETSEQI